VRSAYQDSKGRIYFMTYGGLSVYDGVRFKNFNRHNGLSGDMVNDILEIGQDSLLIATNATPSLHVLIHNKVHQFHDTSGSLPIINHFMKDARGVVYMTSDGGLLQMKNSRLYRIPLPEFMETDSAYLGKICDADPYILFSANELQDFRGLYLFDKRSERIMDYKPEMVVYDMSEDPNGRIWIIGANHRLAMIDPHAVQQGKLILGENADELYPRTHAKTTCMSLNAVGNWFLTTDYSLITSTNGETIEIDVSSLANMGGIHFMMADRENLLWICTDGGGVMKVSRPQFKISDISNTLKVAHVATTTHGSWHQVFGGGLLYKVEDEFQPISENLPSNARIFGLANDMLYACSEDFIYTASVGKGLALDFTSIIRKPDTSRYVGAARLHGPDGMLIGNTIGLIYYRDGKQVST
jgi:hypothetical protein